MKSGKIGMIISLIPVIFCTILPASGSITTITSWHDTIAKGDTVKLVGVQALSGTGAVWVIGRNYLDIKPVTPDKQGNFFSGKTGRDEKILQRPVCCSCAGSGYERKD